MEDENERNVVICCKRMLLALNKRHFLLDVLLTPHIEDEYVGETIDRCPWCGSEDMVDPYKEVP